MHGNHIPMATRDMNNNTRFLGLIDGVYYYTSNNIERDIRGIEISNRTLLVKGK